MSRSISIHRVACGAHLALPDFDLVLEVPHHRVVLEQIGKNVVVGQVVDRHHFDPRVGTLGDDPEHGAADAGRTH